MVFSMDTVSGCVEIFYAEVGGSNIAALQFNFGVKDYGDLNRSHSKAYTLFCG